MVDSKWFFVLGIVLLVALAIGIAVGVVLLATARRRDDDERH